MPKPVRWGILGAANFAREQMAPAIHMARGAELFALATSDDAKAEGFRDFAPNLKVHASYEALLADPEVEAVYIPLPNHLHLEWSLKAVEAGKHVLTEKPMAMHASEFDRLIEARDRSGLLVAEAYMIVHHPQWIRARELVQGGTIGKLVHVDAAFSYHLLDMGNIRNRPETGGGSLPDIGVYTFGSTRFVSGRGARGRGPRPGAARERGGRVRGLWARFPASPIRASPPCGCSRGRRWCSTARRGAARGLGTVQRQPPRPRAASARDHRQRPHLERWPAATTTSFSRELRPHPARGRGLSCPLEFSRGTQRMIDMVLEAEGR
jgi:hypothetical protein